MHEDLHLLQRLRQGDEVALRQIYEKYRDGLLMAAVCMVRDLATAEDCLHDVFVTLATVAPQLRIRSSLKSYLTVCVANRARDHLRKRPQSVSIEDVGEILTSQDNPAISAASREDARTLFETLLQLPDEQREVITLHLHGQLKFREIATGLNVSINTVQSRFRYGIEKLRSLIGGGEES